MNDNYQKWKENIDIIRGEIEKLIKYREIYKTIIEIVKSNKKIDKFNSYYAFLNDSFTVFCSIVIRKHVKNKNDGSITFVKLLEEIKGDSGSITKSHYYSLNRNPHVQEMLKDQWARYCDGKTEFITPEYVTRDIDELTTKARKIEKLGDKVIAHTDAKPPRELPTYGEVDDCIDLMEKQFKKYYLLFYDYEPNFGLPDENNWTEIFLVPWIVEDSTGKQG